LDTTHKTRVHDALLVDKTGAPGSSPAHSGSAVQASLSRRPPTSSPPARHSYRVHGLLRQQILASGADPLRGARGRCPLRARERSIFDLKRRVLLHYGCYFCSSTACFTRIIGHKPVCHGPPQLLLKPASAVPMSTKFFDF